MRQMLIRSISCYQKIATLLNIRCCRFEPTCSQYMKDALIAQGIFRGAARGVGRILRCHPFSAGGYDPVR